MVVMALIVVLAGIAMASYRNSVTLAQEAVLREDLFRMRDAIDQYYADKNKYPSTLEALVSDGYLRAVPEDPFTRSNATWQEVPAEPDANSVSSEPGVYNVRSGSDKTSMQGTPYSEW
jgi:general secretion pathway protein G